MGRIARPWPWLAGDNLSDPHHSSLPHVLGVVKSPATICKYSTRKFHSRDFWPTKGLWEQITGDSISNEIIGSHGLCCNRAPAVGES
jgi:hypothetical protein